MVLGGEEAEGVVLKKEEAAVQGVGYGSPSPSPSSCSGTCPVLY